ncbi:MAG: DUF1080 domain-containing protein [Planctomycetes bacterium]|nr:DUF1080 domain-containing protein [Planctomycetota bacterium]
MQTVYLFRSGAAVVLGAVVALALSGPSSISAEDKKDEGWIPLFNGKDLTGWKMFNPPSGEFKELKEVKNAAGKVVAFVGVTNERKDKKGNVTPSKEFTLWQVKDGTIVGGGPASHLFTEIEADNFHYRVEAKINDKGNSGQYFRTAFGPGFPKGYEAQINATHGDQIRTGSLYPSFGKLSEDERKQILVLKDAPNKPDEFFVQEVVADGPHIQIFVNGKKTVDFTDPNKAYTKGHFALQGHDPGSVMTFKRVEYKPIKK